MGLNGTISEIACQSLLHISVMYVRCSTKHFCGYQQQHQVANGDTVVECEINSFKNSKPCIYFLSNYVIGFIIEICV